MIVDAHTDVLMKMLENEKLDFYTNTGDLSVNYPNMVKGNVGVQVFAIFVAELNTSKFIGAIHSIDIFYQKILNSNTVQLAKSHSDIEQILAHGKKVGILSLEGAEAIERDLAKLRTLYNLGVRAIGLTWNNANEVADGVREERGGGLTRFGHEVMAEINRLGMITDVSHLSEKGFWEVLELSNKPVIASHSNAKSICNHPRNLSDKQIKAIIDTNGMIGVTFVRSFVSKKERPDIDDLLLHIEHIATLGGIYNIGLGSDFDGATTIVGLEDAGKYANLANALYKNYTSSQAEAILGTNWLNYFKRVL